MKQNSSGFSLTEIVVVVIILGISASFILPRFTGTLERVRASEGVQILTALLGAQKRLQFETGSYTAVLADLDIEIPRADNFDIPPTVIVAGGANPIATIIRTNSYTLRIDENGNISCVDGGGTPDFTCAQAGY